MRTTRLGTLRKGVINIDNEQITTAEDSVIEQPQAGADQSAETTAIEDSQEQSQETASADAQGQSEEESFFDPKSVPDELKPAYKQMQAAFTKKTQEIAKAKAESEALMQKAQAYDKFQPFIPMVEGMMNNRGQQQSPEMAALEQRLRAQGYDDQSIQFMKQGVSYALDIFNQNRSTERIVDGIEKAGQVDKRLNDPTLTYQVGDRKVTYGQIVEQYVASDPNWQRDPVGATKRAIALVDTLINQGKTEGKKELSASAQSKARKFPLANSSPLNADGSSQPLSIREAFKQAQEENGWK